MPFCEKCGSELEPEEKFCPNCGAKVMIRSNKENLADKIKEESTKISSNENVAGIVDKIKNIYFKEDNKLNLKRVALSIIVLFIVVSGINFITSMGHDVNVSGATFHIPSGYGESISGREGALEHYNKMDNVVCYERNGSNYNFFIIATKNVGNKKIDNIEKNGQYATINGKQGIIKNVELRPIWDFKKSKFIGFYDDVQFSYVENGQYICVATTDEASLNGIIK